MTCVHKVKWSVKRPEDCRFRLSVSHYKDRIVAPDEYSGVTVVTPSDSEQVLATKDKLVRDDITVSPAPEPDLEPLTIDSLTQQGTFLPAGDGFSQVIVEEDWDGVLYPIEGDPDDVFDAKWVEVKTGDKVIVDGVGLGRWFGFRNPTTDLPLTVRVTIRSPLYDHMRFVYDVDCDCILVLAGYNATADGSHSTNSAYQFRGEYLKWKIIHAS